MSGPDETLRARLAAAAADGVGAPPPIQAGPPEAQLAALLDRIAGTILPRRLVVAADGAEVLRLPVASGRVAVPAEVEAVARDLRAACDGSELAVRWLPSDDTPPATPTGHSVAALRAALALAPKAAPGPAARLGRFADLLEVAHPGAVTSGPEEASEVEEAVDAHLGQDGLVVRDTGPGVTVAARGAGQVLTGRLDGDRLTEVAALWRQAGAPLPDD